MTEPPQRSPHETQWWLGGDDSLDPAGVTVGLHPIWAVQGPLLISTASAFFKGARAVRVRKRLLTVAIQDELAHAHRRIGRKLAPREQRKSRSHGSQAALVSALQPRQDVFDWTCMYPIICSARVSAASAEDRTPAPRPIATVYIDTVESLDSVGSVGCVMGCAGFTSALARTAPAKSNTTAHMMKT